MIVDASRDIAALENYLPIFIDNAATRAESGLAARRKALRMQAAVNRERLERTEPDRAFGGRAIPHAFELWIGHLGRLDQLATGVRFTLDDLTAEEAHGLALFRRARDRFWNEHRSCALCSSINLASAAFCGGCGAQFR